MTPTDMYLLQESLDGGLEPDTIAIIKEPTGTFFVGFPFNFRAEGNKELRKKFYDLNYSVSSDADAVLSKLQDYDIASFTITDGILTPVKIHYLYSIPSAQLTL